MITIADPEQAVRTRELLRAQIFLRSVLPLLRVVMEEQPELAKLFRGVRATVELGARGARPGALLRFQDGELSVEKLEHLASQESLPRRRPEVRCEFRDLQALNAFFAGKTVLPRLAPFLGGLLHPLVLVRTARLLSSLRILHPQATPGTPAARALRVKLLLYMVTSALAELYRGGYGPMVELVRDSPERVYQWTVGATGSGAYLRMHEGRIKAGRGIYRHRRPFVHFLFPDVDAALAVLTESGSQMAGVRLGRVQTFGSPEYTRKIGLLMQKIDELLVQG